MGTDAAQSKDRIWLCQLLLVFAFGASINGQESQVELAPSGQTPELVEFTSAPSLIPGTEFFEQALGLLKVPYEEASVEHIETMNLVVRIESCLRFVNDN